MVTIFFIVKILIIKMLIINIIKLYYYTVNIDRYCENLKQIIHLHYTFDSLKTYT